MTLNYEITQAALDLLPAKKAFEYNVLPIKVVDGSIYLGLADTTDQRLLNDLKFDTGKDIIPIELPSELILQNLRKAYPENNNPSVSSHSDTRIVSESSNIDFVNQIINGAIKAKASDIHLEVYENFFRIRYRIDGHLREIINQPIEKSLPVISRLKVMANLDISEKRRPQDGRIRITHNGMTVDIRVSSLPTNFGEKIVLRLLDKSQINLDLKKLGLDESALKIIERNLNHPHGMILVTGPTGSGKTTTLYAALKEVHSIERNILTIEDPIEYNLPGINQSNVKPDIGFTFANALRAFLRQDPDIIMVGEIRDKETAEIAIRASLTGHLVFSTLHTNDSISAITRLIDMGIEPFLVASSVKMIIAQRLVRKLCTCKQKDERGNIREQFPGEEIFKEIGCDSCSNTGFRGRVGIFETIEVTEDIGELIAGSATRREIKSAANKNNFRTLRESGIDKIISGTTTYEEVLRETI